MRVTPISGQTRWCTQRTGPGQSASSRAAKHASSGHAPNARAASSSVRGKPSKLTKWSHASGVGRCACHSSHKARKFNPVPNPVSATVNSVLPAQASGRPQPCRKTARVSASPSPAVKYTSPASRATGVPSSFQSIMGCVSKRAMRDGLAGPYRFEQSSAAACFLTPN